MQRGWLAALFGGYEGARFLHFWITVGYVAFFVIHIAQVIRAGWNNFRGMVAGVEIVEIEDSGSPFAVLRSPAVELAGEAMTDIPAAANEERRTENDSEQNDRSTS